MAAARTYAHQQRNRAQLRMKVVQGFSNRESSRRNSALGRSWQQEVTANDSPPFLAHMGSD
eukprot:5095220-Amphidinium_carterae.1